MKRPSLDDVCSKSPLRWRIEAWALSMGVTGQRPEVALQDDRWSGTPFEMDLRQLMFLAGDL